MKTKPEKLSHPSWYGGMSAEQENKTQVWIIIRPSQYVRHLAVDKYFTSEKAAKAALNKLKVKQGAIAVPLDAA